MPLLPVEDALSRILEGAEPLGTEHVPLARAAGRVLAEPLVAKRTQPPFDASAMDGYAVRAEDVFGAPVELAVIGVAAAGRRFAGLLGPRQAVRIFTGAPMPAGADTVVIQENTEAVSDNRVRVLEGADTWRNVRRAGLDFREGDALLPQGRMLDPAALSLAASGNHADVPVVRKPLVAVLATGDELVGPGSVIGPDQIVASNSFGVLATAEAAGARLLDLGIAPDRKDAIGEKVRQALDAQAEILVTVGGASVGDHDLVGAVLAEAGMELAFWKIAMRPGKPLMFGSLGPMRCLGLPGNPVASLVCANVFLRPLVARLAGRPHAAEWRDAVLGADMPANDGRRDFVRAVTLRQPDRLVATPFAVQDSSMLKVFSDADALIIRPADAPPARVGEPCRVLMLR